MNLLFLGGYFDSVLESQISSESFSGLQYAANKFQLNIIRGLRAEGVGFEVLSAPFIAPFPQGYKKLRFSPLKRCEDVSVHYVSFCNLWGYRNISRKRALTKAIDEFVETGVKQKIILVYSLHTPLLQAALYAKKKDIRIKVCLVVPDLPQYMNFSDRKWSAYKLFKKIDIWQQVRLLKGVDGFVVLTKEMATALGVNQKPYIVVEGITDLGLKSVENNLENKHKEKVCLYAGGLQKAYGISLLCEAFIKADIPNSELHIYGRGDYEDELRAICQITNKIKYLGVKPNSTIVKEEVKASLLINPRPIDSEFTKYSFPSKNMEYMASGTPLLTTKLPGMPEEYNDYVYLIEEVSVDGICRALKNSLSLPDEVLHQKGLAAREFVLDKKNYIQQTQRILDLVRSL